ncbi:type I polyketide synthase [Streptomyces sp. NPDC101132]|uniref:type I polyketide synthase n=1 Tax=Streptomyces sp. NPDC101132 TaxID=3366110 RepID=UPI0037F88D98
MSPSPVGATAVPPGPQGVAVIGMACRLPGAPDLRAFHALLREGRDGISRPAREELLARGVDPAYAGRENFVPAMGVIEDSRRFDWSFFRYSRAEAAAMDPQQRVFLECAATAVDDAGIDPGRFRGRIGVYAGADRSGPGRDDAALGELARYIGREKDFVATRVAYKLGLRGPAITVQTACSTSLTAVHLAVRALLGGECDAALAGGVTVMPHGEWGYLFEPGGILAPDGYCRPFDADAAGTVPSEGVGVVVLKRLADALRDGDRIAAVIAGTAVNNDGAEKMAYTAPSAAGQSEVIRAALDAAGLTPADIGHVEAHGTATRLGDPIEVQALTEVYGETGAGTGWCALGAVKGNIGHTGAAAGVTGLIKTALMLEHREIPPTAHYGGPNPLLELERSPFRVAEELGPWELREGQELRAGAVSSFGVGGTNAHAVLTEAPPHRPARARTGPAAAARPHLLPVSAHGPEALERLDLALAERFGAGGGGGSGDSGDFGGSGGSGAQDGVPDLAAAAWTLAGRRVHRHRQAVVVRDPAQAADALRAAAAAAARRGTPARLGKVAFLFPGQGTLKHAAGEAAHRMLPGFRAAFEEIRKIAYDDCGVDLTPVVVPAGPGGPGGRDAQGGPAAADGTPAAAGPAADAAQGSDDWFADTVHQQLGLFALGFAFGRQLAEWGITPHAMLGNSIGEYAAAALAEVWTLPDAVGLVHRRARAMRDAAPGRMAVVEAPADEVEARLPAGCGVTVAVRGNGSAVLSGDEAAVELLLAGDAFDGLRVTPVHTRRAFHSPAMNQAAEAVRDHLSSMPARPPRLPYVSNTTGAPVDPDAAATPDHWAAHLREPVLLDAGTATLLASGCTTFLELGPGGSMTGSLRAAPGWDPRHRTVRLAPGGRGGAEAGLLDAIGALWELGADRALETVLETRYADPGDRPERCSLPAHPYLGEDPYQVGRPAPAPAAAAPAPVRPDNPAGGRARSDSPAGPARGTAPAGSAAPPGPPARTARSVQSVRSVLEEVWCQTLGVAAVSDGDDFFALGGESLLALALTTAVRERAGARVSVTDFTLKGTFGGLLELAAAQLPAGDGDPADAAGTGTPRALPAGVATLAEGTGRPFFLVADAVGTALPYRDLATRLALPGDRPVLALETPAGPGARTVGALAAAHVRTLLRVQPEGPYTLGGWSFGAVVAHEAARLLALRGREVDLLVSLDGWVPDTGPLPVAADPAFLLGGVRAGLDALLGVGPLAAAHRRSPELRRRFLAGQAAVLRHRARPVGCPAVLFKAGAGPAEAARLARRLTGLHPGGLRVVPVGGDHWSMLRPPYADDLAARVREALAAADPADGAATHKERKDP